MKPEPDDQIQDSNVPAFLQNEPKPYVSENANLQNNPKSGHFAGAVHASAPVNVTVYVTSRLQRHLRALAPVRKRRTGFPPPGASR